MVLNRWPFCVFRGGLAERSNAADCKSVDGALTAVQGSESLTHRQTDNTPAKAGTFTGVRTAQPKPHESDNLSMRHLAVELNRRFHSDVPQLHGESR